MTTRSITRIRSARRARQWAIVRFTTSVIGTTEAQKSVVDLQALLETDLGFNLNNVTASAIRLRLNFHFASGSTVGDSVQFAYGIIWASDDAIAAGAASIPNPANDSSDWMAHGGGFIVSESTAQHVPRGGDGHMMINDSMRKQRENSTTLVLVTSAQTVQSTLQIHGVGRVLFILP